jgi:transposase
MAGRLNLNSRNSSKPPSTDGFNNNEKNNTQNPGAKNKPGGQPGRIGTTLQKIDNPDKIKILEVERSTLPLGNYKPCGYETRQVFDIDIRRVVTEYPL